MFIVFIVKFSYLAIFRDNREMYSLELLDATFFK